MKARRRGGRGSDDEATASWVCTSVSLGDGGASERGQGAHEKRSAARERREAAEDERAASERGPANNSPSS
jgi:hypothetical protein